MKFTVGPPGLQNRKILLHLLESRLYFSQKLVTIHVRVKSYTVLYVSLRHIVEGATAQMPAIILCGLRLADRPQDGNALGWLFWLADLSMIRKGQCKLTCTYMHTCQLFPVTLQSTAVCTFQSNWVMQTVYGVCCSLATFITCLQKDGDNCEFIIFFVHNSRHLYFAISTSTFGVIIYTDGPALLVGLSRSVTFTGATTEYEATGSPIAATSSCRARAESLEKLP